MRPGDVLLTGNPSGVGPMEPGDVVGVEIDQLGPLTNPVVQR
ncbi:fumarylacetoacetate hydrolase family protein [Streptomyces sp. PSKA54]|uniref:Fumarylacetoacetate hydrolase family protein n=1 Tax=Streptomyces himalayensis subsp. aureolus TaxID=2758039 RepID=A0A7W2HGM0_9ACTN|nr:fumarylacetoacetate hydrolase family protein [Streptomyces himalayensis]MBA4863041.1 fumarylacetoacetate hydrolase family protein [Streptomyces himalayensis subsp. aureolus]